MVEILDEAKKIYTHDSANWSRIYQSAKEDLWFLSDEEFAQWDAQVAQQRQSANRPVITIDYLSQFVHQVVNDIRMNTPSIKIIPNGSGADIETAEIFQGLVRQIEYESAADEAYDTAAEFSVKSSIGFIRVEHEYVNEVDFEQRLCIKRVVDPSLVLLDSASISTDGSDARHAFIFEAVPEQDWEERFGDAPMVSFPVDNLSAGENSDEKCIWIAEFFQVEEKKKKIVMHDDGSVSDYQEGFELYATIRTVKERVIRRYLLSGEEILEEGTFPGEWIPIVPVYGEEHWYDGKRHLYSLIRKAKDPQKMRNLWRSLETELLLKQPQAPVMVASGSITKYMDAWGNPSKSFALPYDYIDEKGNPIPAPTRLDPPVIPTGFAQASASSTDDIKSTMGLYNASMGLQGNEISGVAIDGRKTEGDVATFHFADNLNRAIGQVGRICVSAAPFVYDTQRIIRIIDEEDFSKEIGINGEMVQEQERVYDLKQGRYDVKIVTGASYTTKRKEAAEFLQNIISAQPEIMNIAGDILFENMDFPKAQVLAARYKKIIDPKLFEETNKDPQAQAEIAALNAQLQETQTQLQQAVAMAESLNAQLIDKTEETEAKIASDEADTETDRLKLLLENKKLDQQMEIEQSKLELEAAKARVELAKLSTPKDRGMGGVSIPIDY